MFSRQPSGLAQTCPASLMLDGTKTPPTPTKRRALLSKSNSAVHAPGTSTAAALAGAANAVSFAIGRAVAVVGGPAVVENLHEADAAAAFPVIGVLLLRRCSAGTYGSSPFAAGTDGYGHALGACFKALAWVHAIVYAEVAADHVGACGG